jgi:hypothetical protein
MHKAAYSPLIFSMASPATCMTSQPLVSVGTPSTGAAVSHFAQTIPKYKPHNALLPNPPSPPNVPVIPVATPAIDEYILLHNEKERIYGELEKTLAGALRSRSQLERYLNFVWIK